MKPKVRLILIALVLAAGSAGILAPHAVTALVAAISAPSPSASP